MPADGAEDGIGRPLLHRDKTTGVRKDVQHRIHTADMIKEQEWNGAARLSRALELPEDWIQIVQHGLDSSGTAR